MGVGYKSKGFNIQTESVYSIKGRDAGEAVVAANVAKRRSPQSSKRVYNFYVHNADQRCRRFESRPTLSFCAAPRVSQDLEEKN